MHPTASESTCQGGVIDAHTIQRKGPLERIIDSANHVLHFKPSREAGGLELEKIGWKRASIFPGYCARHDASLFRGIESAPFTGANEQCVLLAFRNLCNEIYRKQALKESLEYLREVLDRGFSLDQQISAQYSLAASIAGQAKSIQEGNALRAKFESAITSNDFGQFSSKCYAFCGEISVVSSSMFQCEFDFIGNKLADQWNFSTDMHMLSHSIMNTTNGGIIVFVWQNDDYLAQQTVESFGKIDPSEMGDIFVQYCFLNCENTYFSQSWWDSLTPARQSTIKTLAKTMYYNGGKFVATSPPQVDWVFSTT